MNHTKSTPVRLEKQTSFKETFMKGTVTVRFSYPFLFIVGFIFMIILCFILQPRTFGWF